MPSDSRRPYVALTPNQADFALQPLSESSTSINTFLSPDEARPRLRSALDSVQDFISLNAGLLLVTGAQAVFSLVNVAVKTLQNLEEPVSTLEVRDYTVELGFWVNWQFFPQLIIVRMVQLIVVIYSVSKLTFFRRESLIFAALLTCEAERSTVFPVTYFHPGSSKMFLILLSAQKVSERSSYSEVSPGSFLRLQPTTANTIPPVSLGSTGPTFHCSTFHSRMSPCFRFWCLWAPLYLGVYFSKRPSRGEKRLPGVRFLRFRSYLCLFTRTVCSLFGVVLIARPEFLFGSPDGSSTVEGKHRMLAIGCAYIVHCLTEQRLKFTFVAE